MKKNIFLLILFLGIFFMGIPIAYSKIDLSESIVMNKDNLDDGSFYSDNSDCPKLDSIIQFAMNQIGKRYKYGSIGPNRFDCSGLIYYTFQNFDIELGRSSRDQYLEGVEVHPDDIQRGDLVFFYRGRKGHIGHVGMVVEVDSNKNFIFIHSSSGSSAVRLDHSTLAAYSSSFVGARRIVPCDYIPVAKRDPISEPQTNQTIASTEEVVTIQEDVPPPPPPTKKKSEFHYVKSGDSLYAIGKRYGVSVESIMKWNNLKSDKIYPGQKLRVRARN